jgi:hypothetical protein
MSADKMQKVGLQGVCMVKGNATNTRVKSLNVDGNSGGYLGSEKNV